MITFTNGKKVSASARPGGPIKVWKRTMKGRRSSSSYGKKWTA